MFTGYSIYLKSPLSLHYYYTGISSHPCKLILYEWFGVVDTWVSKNSSMKKHLLAGMDYWVFQRNRKLGLCWSVAAKHTIIEACIWCWTTFHLIWLFSLVVVLVIIQQKKSSVLTKVSKSKRNMNITSAILCSRSIKHLDLILCYNIMYSKQQMIIISVIINNCLNSSVCYKTCY